MIEQDQTSGMMVKILMILNMVELEIVLMENMQQIQFVPERLEYFHNNTKSSNELFLSLTSSLAPNFFDLSIVSPRNQFKS